MRMRNVFTEIITTDGHNHAPQAASSSQLIFGLKAFIVEAFS